MYKMIPTELPAHWHKPYRCQAILEEFLKMNTPAVTLDIGNEWKSPKSAYNSLWKSAKRFGYPVLVRTVQGKVYLIRIGD